MIRSHRSSALEINRRIGLIALARRAGAKKIIERAVTLSNVQKITNTHGTYFRVSPSDSNSINIPALERPTNEQIIHFVNRKDEATNTVARQPLRYNMVWRHPRV